MTPIQRRQTIATQDVAAAAAKVAASRLPPPFWHSVRTASASAPASAHQNNERPPKLNSTPKPAAAMAPKAAWWPRCGSSGNNGIDHVGILSRNSATHSPVTANTITMITHTARALPMVG